MHDEKNVLNDIVHGSFLDSKAANASPHECKVRVVDGAERPGKSPLPHRRRRSLVDSCSGRGHEW